MTYSILAWKSSEENKKEACSPGDFIVVSVIENKQVKKEENILAYQVPRRSKLS